MARWKSRFLVVLLGLAAVALLPGCPESEEAGAGAVDSAADTAADTGGGAPCIPSCDWRECGPEPACDQSCGACAASEVCQKGSCIPPGCTPDCATVDCGPDPVCGSYCGGCGAGLTCVDGACVEGSCEPQCGRRECGPDPVCQTSCGVCGADEHCLDGTCVAGPCQQQCGDRACGPDPRCGESCGTCGADESCEAGVCVPAPCTCDPPCGAGFHCDPATCRCETGPDCRCGDRECGPHPDTENCAGVVCGACEPGCVCQDGSCQGCGCVPECGDRACGPDPVCGRSCGECDAGFECLLGVCRPDICPDYPECGDRECGPDPVCGVLCGVCDEGCVCSAGGRCLCDAPGACANADDLAILNEVDATDLVTSCLLNLECPTAECYANCIRHDTGISEACAECYGALSACGLRNCAGRCLADQGGADCLACLDTFCMAAFEACAGIELVPCEPTCGDRTCGPDPTCGLSCGVCAEGSHCEDGVCVPGPCEPDCRDRECGRDPVCGRPCGFCDDGAHCEDGRCVAGPCEPVCGDRECGPDPVCGLPCGVCPDGERCREGACRPIQPPGDACNNADDLAILNDVDPVSVAQVCLLEGGCGLEDRACIASCIADQTGVSAACSDCFAGLGVCAARQCLVPCLGDPGGAACMGCIADACLADFEACSGVTWNPGCVPDCGGRECGPDPICGQSCGACDADARCVQGRCEPIGPPPADACNNDRDLALLNQTDAQAVAEACLFGAGCGTDEACLARCVADQTGVSDGCAACYGALATCGLESCVVDCLTDPEGEACFGCLEQACLPAFEACAGVTWEEPPTCTPQCENVACGGDGCGGSCGECAAGEICTNGQCLPFEGGVCADDENLAILLQLDFGTLAFACVPQCFGDVPCLTDCVEGETGLGSGCAFCVAVTADCAVQFCLNDCLNDPEGAACAGCVLQACGEDFSACAGVDLPEF